MRTVLACIDASAAAEPVLMAAHATAPLFGADIEAIHVAEDDDTNATAAARFHHLSLRALRGDVVEQLLAAARRPGVAAVTVGARSQPTGHRSVGHVVWELANGADAPILVVPPEANVADRIDRVLIAMKGTPANAKHLRHAVELAGGANLELVVVQVADEHSIPSFSDQVHYEVDAYAREFLARYVPGAPDARLDLRIGDPAEEILQAAESTDAQVIAVGFTRGAHPGDGVAHQLLTRSHLPVLLVTLR